MEEVRSLIKPIQELERKRYPVKILQFGIGNFLRGFADWIFQEMNDKTGLNAGVSAVQSISTDNLLASQEGLYTVILKGFKDEEFVSKQYKIDIIQRVVNPAKDFEAFLNEALNPDLQFIISNTTEAGIVFQPKDNALDTLANSFPGKLTQLLYHRFKNKLNSSILILPTELIEQNGIVLKSCIQKYATHWSLPAEFNAWLNVRITFCNTLVDRIVSGFPKRAKEIVYAELGYIDELAVEAEWFHLWVIEGPRWIEEVLPLKKAGLNVIYTHDLTPYRLRKVRILNGAHSCMACIGYLAGLNNVRETIEHPIIGTFIKRLIFDDIVPNIPGDLLDLENFADEVTNRFRNPAIDHQLLSIALASFSKFNVRVLPSLLSQVEKNGIVPDRLAYSFAALFYFYRGARSGKEIPLNDRKEVIEFCSQLWKEGKGTQSDMKIICQKIFGQQGWWSHNLSTETNLIERTAYYLYQIDQKGIVDSLKEL